MTNDNARDVDRAWELMKKIGFAVLIGAILGAFDGLTAWFTPAVRDQIGTIVMLSSLKSVFAGLLIGVFAYFVEKRVAIAIFGLIVGLALAYLVATAKGADTGAYTLGRIAGRHNHPAPSLAHDRSYFAIGLAYEDRRPSDSGNAIEFARHYKPFQLRA